MKSDMIAGRVAELGQAPPTLASWNRRSPSTCELPLESVEADDSGAVADYIPELASADPDQLAVAVSTVDGYIYEVGDTETEFSIQSISKPFVYALALADRGFDEVLGKIGVEPTGDAFNDISLEEGTGRPRNPMVNAGAIATHTLAGPDGASAASSGSSGSWRG